MCDQDIDDCASNPCVRGTCTDLVGEYRCECPSGYFGKHCENFEDPCVLDDHVIVNVKWEDSTYKLSGDVYDNGKIYLKRGVSYTFKTDMSASLESRQEMLRRPISFSTSQFGIHENVEDYERLVVDDGYTHDVDDNNYHQNVRITVDDLTPRILYMYSKYTDGDSIVVETGSFPCYNGGTCNGAPGTFSCICAQGYYGSRCEFKI